MLCILTLEGGPLVQQQMLYTHTHREEKNAHLHKGTFSKAFHRQDPVYKMLPPARVRNEVLKVRTKHSEMASVSFSWPQRTVYILFSVVSDELPNT